MVVTWWIVAFLSSDASLWPIIALAYHIFWLTYTSRGSEAEYHVAGVEN